MLKIFEKFLVKLKKLEKYVLLREEENLIIVGTKLIIKEHKEMLDDIKVNAWDLIQSGSGGHKCITNISGLNFMGRSNRPPKGNYKYNPDSEDSPYVKFTKMIQNEFVRLLQTKIENK